MDGCSTHPNSVKLYVGEILSNLINEQFHWLDNIIRSHYWIMKSSDLFSQRIVELRASDLDFNAATPLLPNIFVPSYENALANLLNICDQIGFKKSTKYLAKMYFDAVFANEKEGNQSKIELFSVVCFKRAIETNENQLVSQHFSMDYAIRLCQGRFQLMDFLSAEYQLMQAMKFKLKMTTPYDFIRAYDQIYVIQPPLKSIFSLVEKFLDFALTLVQTYRKTAEELFYACFMLSVEKKLHLTNDCLQQKHSSNWDKVVQLKETILEYYKSYDDGFTEPSPTIAFQ